LHSNARRQRRLSQRGGKELESDSEPQLKLDLCRRAEGEMEKAGELRIAAACRALGDIGTHRDCSAAKPLSEAEPLVGRELADDAVDQHCQFFRRMVHA
jgi:hypothetical protein